MSSEQAPPSEQTRAAGLGDTAWRYLTSPVDPSDQALSRETLVGRARPAVIARTEAAAWTPGTRSPRPGRSRSASRSPRPWCARR